MRFYPTLFFVLLCAGGVMAQQVKWSPVIENKDNNYIRILGGNDNGFYVLKSNISFEDERDRVGFRDRHYALSFYTNEMIARWTKNLQSPYRDGKIVSVNLVNGRILITHSLADKKQKIYRLYMAYLSEDGTYADTSKMIAESGYSKLDDANKPDIYISQDQNIFTCVYRTIPDKSKHQNFHFIVIDSSISFLYKKDFMVPYDEKGFEVRNIAIANSGGFCLFGTRYETERKIKSPGESYYIVYYCAGETDEVRSSDIKSEQYFLSDASMTYDNINRQAVVAGFYSDLGINSFTGTFYCSFRIDTAETPAWKRSPFDQQFLQKFRGEAGRGRELTDYSVQKIILRRDGGAVIVAEAMSISYSSYYDYFSQMYITHRYYTFGNIIALNMNPDGSVMWNNVISKEQQSRDDGGYYSSYCSSIYGTNMHYIYNKYIDDNPSVLISTMNSKGEQRTDVLFNEEEHVRAIPGSGKQIAEDEVILPAYKEGKMRFAKITF